MLDKIYSALCKSRFYADARLVRGVSSAFLSEDGKISGTSGEICGIGVRAIVNGSVGYAWSTNLSDFNILLKKAEKLASLNKGGVSLAECEIAKGDFGRNHPFPTAEEKVAQLKEAGKSAISKKTRNATLALRDSNTEKAFLSSEGAFLSQKSSYVYFSVVAVAKEGAQMQRGIDRASSRTDYSGLDFCAVAKTARESAERLLRAEPPPKGRFSVIMNPEMTGVFSHEAVGHASEGDSIVERESLFKGLLGKKIANENVTIIDDPSRKEFGNYAYDDEGVKGEPAPIIEKGILKTFLHSRESAKALNLPPNGHCRAQDFKFAPIVRMSNTVFGKGKDSENDIFDVKDGIYAIGMKGGSVDIFTGDFMFAAREAWLIKNGSKEKLLRDTTISGNILETLKGVECVGKDWGTSPGMCGKSAQGAPVSDGGPHIRVANMKVG